MARNPKEPYELITNEKEIINNILEFKLIIEDQINRDGKYKYLYRSFPHTQYWYCFPNSDIIVPNLYLAYNFYTEKIKNLDYPYPEIPYDNNPNIGYNLDGTKAQNVLSNYFKDISNSKKENTIKILKAFIKKYTGSNISENKLKIKEPINQNEFLNIPCYDKAKIFFDKDNNTKKQNAILIKKGIPEKQENNPSKTDEQEENKSKIFKGFNILLKEQVIYISSKLKEKYDNVWQVRVYEILNEKQRRGLNPNRNEEEFIDALDTPKCLFLLDLFWKNIFCKILPIDVKNWNGELIGIRNEKIAHAGRKDISDDDTWRSLDNMARLCGAFGKKDKADEIRKIRDTVYKKSP